MQGQAEVVEYLKDLLRGELAARDQYFLHSRMYQDWGFNKLFERINHEMEEETQHADALLQRILFLEATPDMRPRPIHPGNTVPDMLRADLKLELRDLPGRDGLSRGQAKLAALALLLAQAAFLAEQDGHWPVLQLDDLASELDRHHQQRVLQTLHASGAQVFVTGTESPPVLQQLALPTAWFHVEHGIVTRRS